MAKIKETYLTGLTFKSSKPVKGEGDKITHQATERALRPDDVLNWTDQGETVVIVAADGRKYRVVKKEAEAKAKEGLVDGNKTGAGDK